MERLKKFDIDDKLKVPHIGWNNVNFVHEHPVLQGIDNDSNFYFVHSYYVECKDNSIQSGSVIMAAHLQRSLLA